MRGYRLCIAPSAVGDTPEDESVMQLACPHTDDAAPLLAQLQIDFPSVPRHVRPVIGLREAFYPLVESGKKTTTIRYFPGHIHCPSAPVLPLQLNPSQEIVGSLRIKALEVKPYAAITEADARRDGFSGREELAAILRDIYGDVQPHELISIYEFELLPARPRDSLTLVKGLLPLKDLCVDAVMTDMMSHLRLNSSSSSSSSALSVSLGSTLPQPIAESLLATAISRKVLSDDNVGHFLDPEMRQLSLAGGENLTRRTLARILATPCLHLTHLSLSRCVNMTSKDLIAFFTELSDKMADGAGLPLTSLDITRCPRVNDQVVATVAKCCPNLRKIDLTRCTNVSDAAIVSLAQACNDLQELIVFACPKITNASIFGVLPEHCTALRALSLSRCRLTDTAASGGLARLLARAPELEELGLGRCKRIADSALAAIAAASCASTLQFLDLTSCSASDQTLRMIGASCRRLRTLYLSNCPVVTNETVQAFARSCREMRALYLSSCSLVTDIGVLEIAYHCKELNVLNLSGCVRVTNLSLCEVARQCPSLNTLYLANCELVTGKVIHALQEHCQGMKLLELSGCNPLIATFGEESLSAMHNLQALDVSRSTHVRDSNLGHIARLSCLTYLTFSDTNISDEGVMHLANGFLPRLEWLILSNCLKVTNMRCVHHLLDNLPVLAKLFLSGCANLGLPGSSDEGPEIRTTALPTLQYLFVSSCPQFPDEMAVSLVRRMPNLSSVVFAQSTSIQDATLRCLAQTCTDIRDLDLSMCSMGDEALLEVLMRCGKNLIDLKVSHCKQLSSATFTQALRILQHLETLAVPGCPNFDAPVLRQVPELCPSLSKIVLGREGISNRTKAEVMEQHPGLEIV